MKQKVFFNYAVTMILLHQFKVDFNITFQAESYNFVVLFNSARISNNTRQLQRHFLYLIIFGSEE
jgi:hypothetical protein